VYEGAPTPVTAFFASAPKVAAMALMARLTVEAMGPAFEAWRQIVIFSALASIVLGAVAAIGQKNIKRLLAYSSINNVGFALIGLAAVQPGRPEGVASVMTYMAIYIVMTLGSFLVVLQMRDAEGNNVETIASLSGLSRNHPGLAAAFAIFMFSLAGVPPLAGFFGKFYIFMAAINAHLYTLAVIGVLSSVVGAYYYLRIVKIMYFDEPAEPLAKPVRSELGVVMTVTGLFTILFFVFPGPLLAAAGTAAKALFP
jgi:NADH-quinone oxidoreductase subunit N